MVRFSKKIGPGAVLPPSVMASFTIYSDNKCYKKLPISVNVCRKILARVNFTIKVSSLTNYFSNNHKTMKRI